MSTDSKDQDFRSEFRQELSSRWTIDQLKELVERLDRERDRRYEQRFEGQEKAVAAALAAAEKAVAAALAAQEKAVVAAFESSREAINKAETAQAAYNARSNEFRSALDDQGKIMSTTMIPRIEADKSFATLRDMIDAQKREIVDLQKGASRGEGGHAAGVASRNQANWTIGAVLTVVSIIATLIYFLARG